jgi:hypothetical protein
MGRAKKVKFNYYGYEYSTPAPPGPTQSPICNSPQTGIYGEVSGFLNNSDGFYYWYFEYQADIEPWFITLYGSYVGPLSIDYSIPTPPPTGLPIVGNLTSNAVVGELYLIGTSSTVSDTTIDIAYTDLGLGNSVVNPFTITCS